jgi:hypothetical protein
MSVAKFQISCVWRHMNTQEFSFLITATFGRRNHIPYKAWEQDKGALMMCSNLQGARQCLAHNFGQQCNSSACCWMRRAAYLDARSPISRASSFPSINWKCLSFIPCLSPALSLIIIPAACIMFVLARALPPPWLYPKSTMRCQEAWFPNVIPEQTAQNGTPARQCFSRCAAQGDIFKRARHTHTPVAKRPREWKRLLECSAGWHKLICKLLNHPHTPTSNFLEPAYRFSSLFFLSHAYPPHALALFFPLLLPPPSSIFFAPCMCFSLRTHTHTQSCAGCILLQDASECALFSHNR